MMLFASVYQIREAYILSSHDYKMFLSKSNSLIIELGAESSYEKIHLIEIYNLSNDYMFWIAVFSEDIIKPFVSVSVEKKQLLVGYNSNIALIDLENSKLVFERVFGTVIVLGNFLNNKILVISEADIGLYDYRGDAINEVKLDDLIESYVLLNNTLQYQTSSGTYEITL